MRTYGQYCPIARTAEILAERWTPLIVRNLLFGAETFSAIAGGVPAMSRSTLVARLRELERAGVIETRPKPTGRGSLYSLTDGGRDLADTIYAMASWGERWVEIEPRHCDPGFALWAWCRVQLDRDVLPENRVVVAFRFPEERRGERDYWLLVQNRSAEVCHSDPGGDPGLWVESSSQAFVDWHRGARSWRDVTSSGDIRVHGSSDLARSFPRWNLHEPHPG
ncbi:MAG: helix-turn-helix domain-containing protein [Acidimicrobiales bacterium]